MVVPGEPADDRARASSTFGNGMIMLGSAGKHGDGYDALRDDAARDRRALDAVART